MGGLVVDQSSKHLARLVLHHYEAIPLIPKLLSFQLVFNTGAAYGILSNQQLPLLMMSLAAIFALFLYQDEWAQSTPTQWALALIMTGGMGNFIDRLWMGSVTDFIQMHWIPVFNVADMCIFFGALIFIGSYYFQKP